DTRDACKAYARIFHTCMYQVAQFLGDDLAELILTPILCHTTPPANVADDPPRRPLTVGNSPTTPFILSSIRPKGKESQQSGQTGYARLA
ncbi:MAG: hypothetical protein ACXWQZ_15150, partial [Ktedonobacterales bacterium]